MFCPNCGTKNEDDALFCGNCGTRLVIDVPQETPVQESVEEEPEVTPVQENVPAEPEETPVRSLPCTMQTLSEVTGKAAGIIAVCDENFACGIRATLSDEEEDLDR